MSEMDPSELERMAAMGLPVSFGKREDDKSRQPSSQSLGRKDSGRPFGIERGGGWGLSSQKQTASYSFGQTRQKTTDTIDVGTKRKAPDGEGGYTGLISGPQGTPLRSSGLGNTTSKNPPLDTNGPPKDTSMLGMDMYGSSDEENDDGDESDDDFGPKPATSGSIDQTMETSSKSSLSSAHDTTMKRGGDDGHGSDNDSGNDSDYGPALPASLSKPSETSITASISTASTRGKLVSVDKAESARDLSGKPKGDILAKEKTKESESIFGDDEGDYSSDTDEEEASRRRELARQKVLEREAETAQDNEDGQGNADGKGYDLQAKRRKTTEEGGYIRHIPTETKGERKAYATPGPIEDSEVAQNNQGIDEDEDEVDDGTSHASMLSRVPYSHTASLKSGNRPVTALGVDASGARVAVGSVDYDARLFDFGGMNETMMPFKYVY